ncbi:hypothetical protein H1R20_g12945, partial [Candolleomyces eurysporus]
MKSKHGHITGSLHGLAYHIQLSDQYDATEDMRRYLRRRFQDIGLKIGQPNWFTKGNIERLVQAGSGQFVYVATVFKYMSERRGSPAHRLKTVLNWTADQGQVTKPFEALNMLYTSILLNAKEAYEAFDTHSGHNLLLLLKAFHMRARGDLLICHPYHIHVLLNLENDALEILTLDLHSLVCLKEEELGIMELTMYHKSFFKFMDKESPTKDLFVSDPCAFMHLAKCCIQRIIESPELHSYELEDMSVSEQRLITAITELDYLASAIGIDNEIVDFTHKGGWQKIDMVLSKPLGFGHIFKDHWDDAFDWINFLGHSADDLKKGRPEAAAIMSKYLKKWKHFFNESDSD